MRSRFEDDIRGNKEEDEGEVGEGTRERRGTRCRSARLLEISESVGDV
jgi:hypothetical protein